MKPTDLWKELVYPLTDTAIVLALLFFWIMFRLIDWAGLFGIWLLVMVAPAYFRYLLYLLEARANGKEAPVPTAEMFAPADSMWTLTPLVLIALLIWGGIAIQTTEYAWLSAVFGLSVLLVIPSSLGILAVTHSPAESLNPLAIGRMIGVCGATYFIIPGVIIFTTLLFVWMISIGLPVILVDFLTSYQVILLFTLTGGVLYANDVGFDLEIDPPVVATEEEVASDLEKEREKVASHAYGFISRGNRDGGFAHVLDWIKQEPDASEASDWFFAAMLKWEVKEPALFFAQTYFAHLLHHEEDLRALKLISTCIHIDPQWRPKAADRVHALQLAEKYKRDDLLTNLRN